MSRRRWKPPDPVCIFVVACAGELPNILRLVNKSGSAGALLGGVSRVGSNRDAPIETQMALDDTFGVITPGRGLITVSVAGDIPQLPIMQRPDEWESAGLTAELADRFRSAPLAVMIQMQDPGDSIVDTVTFATRLADRATAVARGCADDFNAQRFFGDGSWRTGHDDEEFVPLDHISLHAVPAAPGGIWVHTHGLLKFGRPELEMRGVPQELLNDAVLTVLNFASYVVEETAIAPDHTLGNPRSPLYARTGRSDIEHWAGAEVLELVDVDDAGKPVPIGVERGLRSMTWA